MRIIGRWAARHSTHPHVRAGSKTPDHGFQPTGYELAEAERRGQHEESPAARPGYRGDSGANPPTVPALGLDQQQAAVVLAALEDAAVLRREAIGNCPDCRSADERICTDHEGSWEAAEEYDSLRWHLHSTHRDSQPNHEAAAAPVSAPAESLKAKGPGVGGERGGREGQATVASEHGEIEHGSEPEPGEYMPPAVPDTTLGVPPDRYNIMAGYAREVNRPNCAPDGEPYISPEEGASLGERLGNRAGPGSAEGQIFCRNDASDCWNEASDYEPDREMGE